MVIHSTKALMRISGLLTTTEAAKRADVEPGTIVVWIRYGILPATKLGYQWVVDADELNEYLATRPQVTHE